MNYDKILEKGAEDTEMRYKYILFDLDGTLLNTNKLIIKSFKYTLKKHLDINIDDADILKYFGEPLMVTLERFSKEKAKEMFDTYIEYNERIHDEMVEVFGNVDNLLDEITRIGCKTAIVTSKRKALAKRGLTLFNLLDYFDDVIALEDTEKHKPNPEPILEALSRLNASKNEALMVGDSEFDIKCAHNAGVDSVFVSWSQAGDYQDKSIKPDYIIKDISEIIYILRTK
ncbi:pyrophosphatase PpaX [Lutispora sp.]|uniref:pyrophosphatase PpaX n=1 Tax=Lutispora sp. TaxID=2828727 RepID=UPI0035683290